MTKEQALKEIDEVITDASNLLNKQSADSVGKVRVSENLFRALDRFAPANSTFRHKAVQLREIDGRYAPGYVLDRLIGVVGSLRDAIAGDQLQRIESLVRGDAFSDFLSMSEHLLEEGYKDAAAVIAGTVIEQHLRALCVLNSIATTQPDGKWRKAEMLNQDLVKAGATTTLEQKMVTSWLGLRNAAAHGEYEKYEETQVRLMIQAVSFFMARHPA